MPISAFQNQRCDFEPTGFLEVVPDHVDQTVLANLDGDLANLDTLSTVQDVELRDYSVEKYINPQCLPNDAPYIKIGLKSGKSAVIRKTSLCWLFTKDKYKLSSDRLKRVATK